jgi:hypothetical protein
MSQKSIHQLNFMHTNRQNGQSRFQRHSTGLGMRLKIKSFPYERQEQLSKTKKGEFTCNDLVV